MNYLYLELDFRHFSFLIRQKFCILLRKNKTKQRKSCFPLPFWNNMGPYLNNCWLSMNSVLRLDQVSWSFKIYIWKRFSDLDFIIISFHVFPLPLIYYVKISNVYCVAFQGAPSITYLHAFIFLLILRQRPHPTIPFQLRNI